MKTVIIHGQSHKGSSYSIGRMLANQIASEDEITEFFLPKDLNHFCLGCCQCLHADTKCPFYNEKRVIESAIEAAEILIFTTPTYCMRASAPMKSFIDLTFINWMPHRPKACMFEKKAVVISTAAGGGTQKAIKDITNSLFYWGVPYIKSRGFNVNALNWRTVDEKRKRRIERSILKLSQGLKKSGRPRVGLRTRIVFNLFRSNIKKIDTQTTPFESDYLHWLHNGWLGKARPWKS